MRLQALIQLLSRPPRPSVKSCFSLMVSSVQFGFFLGEKAHQCEECGKCFRRHDHLTVHYKSVHLGEKVWQKYVIQITDLCFVLEILYDSSSLYPEGLIYASV